MKTYSVSDVVMMSGLSERTVREYIKLGLLAGEKKNGVWNFDEDAIAALFANPAVRQSVKAKANAIVSDFMLAGRKAEDEICSVLDLCADAQKAEEISEFFCEKISLAENTGIAFSFEHRKGSTRVIIKGPAKAVLKIMGEYYAKE